MDMKEREVQYCSPEELIPYEKNPRDNRLAIDDVVRSIEEYGFTNPILVNEEKVILAGHTRREAAILAGMERVPYIVVDGLTEAQQRAYRLADNKLSELALWDEDLLKRNIPANITEIVDTVVKLDGKVDSETLLALLPFVDNPKEVLEKVKAQKKENMKEFDPYSIQNAEDDSKVQFPNTNAPQNNPFMRNNSGVNEE